MSAHVPSAASPSKPVDRTLTGDMFPRRVAAVLLLVIAAASAAWAQRFRVLEGPGMPLHMPPAHFSDGALTDCTLLYTSTRPEANGWARSGGEWIRLVDSVPGCRSEPDAPLLGAHQDADQQGLARRRTILDRPPDRRSAVRMPVSCGIGRWNYRSRADRNQAVA